MKTLITNYILDIVKRFLAKTPKFFKVVQIIAIITAIVTGLPVFLQSNGVVLPAAITAIASKVVAITSVISAFIAQLTVVPEQQSNLKFK